MSQTADRGRFGQPLATSNSSFWRRIRLEGDFTLKDAVRIESKLRQFENKYGASDEVTLLIDSLGGSMTACFYLCDVIWKSPVPVTGLVMGDCIASAFCVLQACKRRVSVPSGRLGLHNNSKTVTFTLDPDTEDEVIHQITEKERDLLNESRERIIGDLRLRLKDHSHEELLAMMRNSRIMSAEEALKLGFIDEILPN